MKVQAGSEVNARGVLVSQRMHVEPGLWMVDSGGRMEGAKQVRRHGFLEGGLQFQTRVHGAADPPPGRLSYTVGGLDRGLLD